jgi:hypothetical protein
MTEELRQELEKFRGKPIPPEELAAQRVSFAYGNAAKKDKGTKDSVRRASTQVLVA